MFWKKTTTTKHWTRLLSWRAENGNKKCRSRVQISFSDNITQVFFFLSYTLPYSLLGIVSDTSGSSQSGQQVEYGLIWHLVLLISAAGNCERHGASTILSEGHSCGPIFFSPQAVRKAIISFFCCERETCCWGCPLQIRACVFCSLAHVPLLQRAGWDCNRSPAQCQGNAWILGSRELRSRRVALLLKEIPSLCRKKKRCNSYP